MNLRVKAPGCQMRRLGGAWRNAVAKLLLTCQILVRAAPSTAGFRPSSLIVVLRKCVRPKTRPVWLFSFRSWSSAEPPFIWRRFRPRSAQQQRMRLRMSSVQELEAGGFLTGRHFRLHQSSGSPSPRRLLPCQSDSWAAMMGCLK